MRFFALAVAAVVAAGLIPRPTQAAPRFEELSRAVFGCAPDWGYAPEPKLERRSLSGLSLSLQIPRGWPSFRLLPPYRAEVDASDLPLTLRVDVQRLGNATFDYAANNVERRMFGHNLLRPRCRAQLRERYGRSGLEVKAAQYRLPCLSPPCRTALVLYASDGERLITVSARLDVARQAPKAWAAVDSIFRSLKEDSSK